MACKFAVDTVVGGLTQLMGVCCAVNVPPRNKLARLGKAFLQCLEEEYKVEHASPRVVQHSTVSVYQHCFSMSPLSH